VPLPHSRHTSFSLYDPILISPAWFALCHLLEPACWIFPFFQCRVLAWCEIWALLLGGVKKDGRGVHGPGSHQGHVRGKPSFQAVFFSFCSRHFTRCWNHLDDSRCTNSTTRRRLLNDRYEGPCFPRVSTPIGSKASRQFYHSFIHLTLCIARRIDPWSILGVGLGERGRVVSLVAWGKCQIVSIAVLNRLGSFSLHRDLAGFGRVAH
jgi:hypothetical protein